MILPSCFAVGLELPPVPPTPIASWRRKGVHDSADDALDSGGTEHGRHDASDNPLAGTTGTSTTDHRHRLNVNNSRTSGVLSVKGTASAPALRYPGMPREP